MTRHTLIAGILLIMMTTLGVWRYVTHEEEPTAPLKYTTPSTTSQAVASAGSGLVTVRVDQWKGQLETPLTVEPVVRNIFLTLLDLPSQGRASEQETPSPEHAQSVVDASTYRYVGYLQRDGRQTAFLAKDQLVLAVKSGDRLQAHLRVSAISKTRVTVTDTQSKFEHNLPLITDAP